MTSYRKQQLAAEDGLAQAQRFVCNGERRITEQAEHVARWEQIGDRRQAASAHQVLKLFEGTLAMAYAHLQRERAKSTTPGCRRNVKMSPGAQSRNDTLVVRHRPPSNGIIALRWAGGRGSRAATGGAGARQRGP